MRKCSKYAQRYNCAHAPNTTRCKKVNSKSSPHFGTSLTFVFQCRSYIGINYIAVNSIYTQEIQMSNAIPNIAK